MKYAYWRRPDTTLHKSDDDKYAPNQLLAEIGEKAKINDDRSISWPMTNFDYFTTAVYTSICVLQPNGQELNEHDSQRIIHAALGIAIRKNGGGKPINCKSLIAEVHSQASSLFRKPEQCWTLATSLSIKGFDGFPVKVLGHCVSASSRELFQYPRSLLERDSYVTRHLNTSRYQVIAVQAKHVSVHQAFLECMTAINVLRGLWNLIATFRRFSDSWSSVPKRKWIGDIHVSPIHTMHDADGNSPHEMYMHEPDYTEDAELFAPKSGWAKLEEQRKSLLEQIDRSLFKEDIIDLIYRYTIALDQPNLQVAFLMLWSLLEKITDTVGGNYDETIKRASRPFSDRSVAKQILGQMRLRRNQFVHSAGSSEDCDKLCYITKNFVDLHLLSLIRNDFRSSNIEEHGHFLGLPTDETRLRFLRNQFTRALALRENELGSGFGHDGAGI